MSIFDLFRKTPKQPEAPKEPTKWERVMLKYPIGHKFNYLGTSHEVIDSIDDDPSDHWLWQAEIRTIYSDSVGVLRQFSFGHRHADILLRLKP